MLILASASPRRQELLRNAGIEFIVQPADLPEEGLPGEAPTDWARRLAREKALAVWQKLGSGAPSGNSKLETRNALFALGADTIVVVDEHVLNKPADAADAARMLRMISGRSHQVTTGVCLLGAKMPSLETGNRKLETLFEDVRSETTLVTFDALSDDDIRAYVATGEPMDKAGAYAIQGIASRWISALQGDYFNVVGLPVPLVYRMLREHGVL